jgi:hypothetical protein
LKFRHRGSNPGRSGEGRVSQPERLYRIHMRFDDGRPVAFSCCIWITSRNSATGTRTRVARVRAEYPNQLDYSGRCGFRLANVLGQGWCAGFCVSNAHDPGRTRTCNPRLRGPMPYPLGHGAVDGSDVQGCVCRGCCVAFVFVCGPFWCPHGFGHNCVCFHSSVG